MKIRITKTEIEDDFNNKIEQVKNGYSSQINETQAAMSSIQSEQEIYVDSSFHAASLDRNYKTQIASFRPREDICEAHLTVRVRLILCVSPGNAAPLARSCGATVPTIRPSGALSGRSRRALALALVVTLQ